MPTVTVVIPTYNRADVLSRAIESVLSQSFEEFELLVVDDGSTDRTQELLDSYSDERLRTIVHETNEGANVARNTGIENARAEYVALLDSDDEWQPTKLEKQLDVLESHSSEWVAAYCDTSVRTPGTTGRLQMLAASLLARTDGQPLMEGDEELVGEILADNVQPCAGSTLVVRTDVAREVGGLDETLDRFQDPEFVLRILGEGKLAYVDEPLVIRHETGAPAADTVAAADEQYLAKYADAVSEFERRGYGIRASHRFLLAKHYFAEGRILHGVAHLRRASAPPRHYPGLLWAIAIGLRRKNRASMTLLAGALVLVGALFVARSR